MSAGAPSTTIAWGFLLLAGLFEIGWVLGMKYSDGFTKVWPSVGSAASLLLSFVAISQALRAIPMGTAYAVWTGIGAAGIALIGIYLFEEPGDWQRIACIALIVAGIVGLKLASP